MYTVNDFFCGCGGLGLGLQRAGFKILKAWDFDKYAVQTYRENIGDHVEQADIKELHIEDVPESFYIEDKKAQKIIDQALQKLARMGNVHATITPDREVKRQNGRRAKEDEEEMFTLTAQDLHGVIQRQRKELVPPGDTCASALIHSRGLETRQDGISHCIKGGGGGSGANFLVEKVPPPITEVCVNDRGFTEKEPQVSNVAPTLRAENHGNHPKVIEERSTPPPRA